MNPRVSRSSALASKATGYPIAKVAAKLAVGYTLDEIPNDLTRTTPASFEPTLDYVVVKFPRFAFEKFPGADATLGTQMKSVGESMGIGRTFAEAFWKARRGLEIDPEWRPENLHPWFARELMAPRPEGPVVYRRVDSCAGEVEAASNYFYSTRGERDECPPEPGKSVVILGSGPNRIGQGIEFDYCCVHAAQAFRKLGYEAVLLNSNPETVSTDYDTSDRLYLEPVTAERVLDVCALEQPLGVVVTLGGQTPLRLAHELAAEGVPLLGDPLPAIDAAEDRGTFGRVLDELGLRAPRWGTATTQEEALAVAAGIGYPVLVRPHYVLGGRRMRVVRRPEELELHEPSLVDEFLEGALELDVDVVGDGRAAWVAGILEHVEPAGVHSGDSACVIPAPSVSESLASEIAEIAQALVRRLGVRGLLNMQLAVKDGDVYVLEANPRASRTVPFVAKATRVPVVEHACRLMLGATLVELGLPERALPTRAWAKEAIFPADRFAGAADRSPEMRSTGEVMAGGDTVSEAYARVQRAAGRSRRHGRVGPPLQIS
jgi:carbamoyl-phosphate synthase large subunit